MTNASFFFSFLFSNGKEPTGVVVIYMGSVKTSEHTRHPKEKNKKKADNIIKINK